MKCPNCGKEMSRFWMFINKALTIWYECRECNIWEEGKHEVL